MDTQWSVEAQLDDPVILVPWSGVVSLPIAYVDIKANNRAIDEIEEAKTWPEVRYALLALNAPSSGVWTAKCDAWILDEEEKQLDFGPAAFGFGLYIDVLASNRATFASLEQQRARAESWAKTLRDSGPDDARVDFVIRPASWNTEPGFAMTVYVFGYGEQEAEARRNWSEASAEVAALIATSAT